LNEHNEKLKGQTKLYFDAFNKATARIEKLESALQIYSCDCSLAEEEDCELGDWTMLSCGYRARKALEGKDD
jgi:hypothetical protein